MGVLTVMLSLAIAAALAGCPMTSEGEDGEGEPQEGETSEGETMEGDGEGAEGEEAAMTSYRVSIQNLTDSQPISPIVAATHNASVSMFSVGELASDALRAIAEAGDPAPMVTLLEGLAEVTSVANAGQPLTLNGTTTGDFSDSITLELTARAGDVLSLAGMLIATNDGFAGLDSAALPESGSMTYSANSYDAGTEDNTEAAADLVPPASDLGPVEIEGAGADPDNPDTATDPQEPIAAHPGITGDAGLDAMQHSWEDPVLMVTVTVTDGEA